MHRLNPKAIAFTGCFVVMACRGGSPSVHGQKIGDAGPRIADASVADSGNGKSDGGSPSFQTSGIGYAGSHAAGANSEDSGAGATGGLPSVALAVANSSCTPNPVPTTGLLPIASPVREPPAGAAVVSPPMSAFTAHGIALNTVAIAGQAFDNAAEFAVGSSAATGNTWDKGFDGVTIGDVKKNDHCLIVFWARCVQAPGNAGCQTRVIFEANASPYNSTAVQGFSVGPEWHEFFLPFTANDDFLAGATLVSFFVNYPDQTLQIGDVAVLNYRQPPPPAQLPPMPTNQLWYGESDTNAPWRAAAAQRIEELRKDVLLVHVTDANGKPISGASVNVRMLRHAFGFGTAQDGQFLLYDGSGSDLALYKQTIPRLFNMVDETPGLMWKAWAGDWSRFAPPVGKHSVDWALQQGLRNRGHNLIWPSWKYSPTSLKPDTSLPSADAVRTAIRDHLVEEVSAFKGQLETWDVANEPWDNHDLTDLLGNCGDSNPNCDAGLDEMAGWFQEVHDLDSKPKLFVNDYDVLENGGGDSLHRAELYRILSGLIARNAPLDGIGIQGHFDAGLTAPSDMLALLDRFGQLGKELWITEYDIVNDDPVTSGQYTRDFLATIFSHPKVNSFTMIGFWDGRQWKNNAPIYTLDWLLKPAGVAYIDLVFNQWWTCAGGSTDENGNFGVRGFLGDYEVAVSPASTSLGKPATVTAKLQKGGSLVRAMLLP